MTLYLMPRITTLYCGKCRKEFSKGQMVETEEGLWLCRKCASSK